MPIGNNKNNVLDDKFITEGPTTSFDPDARLREVRGTDTNIMDALATENYVGSALQSSAYLGDGSVGDFFRDLFLGNPVIEGDRPLDPNFDPVTYLEEVGRPELAEKAAFTNSPEEVDRLVRFVDEQQRARQNLSLSPKGLVSSMAAGVLTPDIIIGGTSIFKGIRALERAQKLGKGGAAAAAGAGGAGVGTSVMALQEHVLQATQTERTDLESDIAIVGGAAFAGALGATAQALASASSRAATKRYLGELIATNRRPGIDPEEAKAASENASAMRSPLPFEDVKPTKVYGIKSEALSNKVISNVNSLLPFTRSPIVEGLVESPFSTVRRMTHELFDHSILTTAEATTPVQRMVDFAMFEMDVAERRAAQNYANYRKGVREKASAEASVGLTDKARILFSEGEGSYESFQEKVWREMDRPGTYDDPTIVDQAGTYRKLYTQAAEALQERGYLKDVSPDELARHLSRSFDRQKVTANSEEFIRDLAAKYRKETQSRLNKLLSDNPDLEVKTVQGRRVVGASKQSKIGQTGGKVLENIEEAQKYLDELDDDKFFQEAAQETFGKISRQSDELLNADSLVADRLKSRFNTNILKPRGISLSNADLEDWLIKDAGAITQRYVRTAHSAVEMDKLFERMGVDDITDIKRIIQQEYDDAAKSLGPEARIEGAREVIKAKRFVDEAIAAATGTLRDTSRGADFLRDLRAYQVLTMLPGLLLSQLPDIGVAMSVRAIPGTLQRNLVDLAKTINTNIPKAPKGFERGAVQDLIYAFEVENNNSLRAVSQIQKAHLGHPRGLAGKALDFSLDAFGKLTGAAYWNGAWKRVGARAFQSNVAKLLLKWESGTKLSKSDMNFLRQNGIPEEDFSSILSEMKRSLIEVNGSLDIDYTLWSDKELARRFQAAMLSMTRRTVITPTKADLPRWVQSSGMAATLLQFKSFSIGITTKLLIPGLQNPSGYLGAGAAFSMAAGGAVVVLKNAISGKDTDFTPDKFLASAVTRSGWGGFSTDLAMGLMNVAGVHPFSGTGSRYAGLSGVNLVFGPTTSTVTNVSQAVGLLGDVARGEADWKDSEKVLKLLPLYTHPFIKTTLGRAFDED